MNLQRLNLKAEEWLEITLEEVVVIKQFHNNKDYLSGNYTMELSINPYS